MLRKSHQEYSPHGVHRGRTRVCAVVGVICGAFLLPRMVTAELDVIIGGARVATGIITTTQRFYGPQHASVDATGIFMHGADLCRHMSNHASNHAFDVSGKIVFGSRVDAYCKLEQLYGNLNARGAVGLVLLNKRALQGEVARRHGWDKGRYSDRAMTMVNVFTGDVDEAAWKEASAAGTLELRIRPPHDKTLEGYLASWPITLTFRVGIPLAAVVTTGAGTEELARLYRTRNNNMSPERMEIRRMGLALCLVHVPASLITGTMFALGLMTTHDGFHIDVFNFFSSTLTGVFSFATVLVALFLSEEVIHAKPDRPARMSMWKKYPAVIALFAVTLVGSDVVNGILAVNAVDDWGNALIYRPIAISYFLVIKVFAGCYFLQQAYRLSVPLRAYLRKREEIEHSEYLNLAKRSIGRLALALAMNGSLLMINVLGTVFIAVGDNLTTTCFSCSEDSGSSDHSETLPFWQLFLAGWAISNFSKLAVSYWQIQAFRPKEATTSIVIVVILAPFKFVFHALQPTFFRSGVVAPEPIVEVNSAEDPAVWWGECSEIGFPRPS